ncbi:DUF4179 domain-containing protein [Clostridium sp. C8-1-8]|uniref:DUF4179 domain-containing protein n=1 Tax=Clostridium sp. C8-1-8 TaxID=2698831 RepID=UPI001368AEA4|nr:DUF4179 domain-containing protein [Clostridium sp. C8-1-8]
MNNNFIDEMISEKAKLEKSFIPVQVDNIIGDTLQQLPKKVKKKVSIPKKLALAATFMLAILTLTTMAFPAYAKNIPGVNSVFKLFSKDNMIEPIYAQYGSNMELSSKSNGVTITINDVACDGLELAIGYTIESKKDIKDGMNLIMNSSAKFNNTALNSAGLNGKAIDKNTYKGVIHYGFDKKNISEVKKIIDSKDDKKEFTVQLKYCNVDDNIKGDWEFNFKGSLASILKQRKEINTEVDLSSLANDLKVHSLTISPLNTELSLTGGVKSNNIDLGIFAYDDKGRFAFGSGMGGDGNKDGTFDYGVDFKNVNTDAKELTFIPYILNKDNGVEVGDTIEPLNFSGKTILDFKKMGVMTIEKVEQKDNSTLLYYKKEGYIKGLDVFQFEVIGKDSKVYVNYGKMGIDAKDLGDDHYVVELPKLKENQNYTIKTTNFGQLFDVREDLKFKIKVN